MSLSSSSALTLGCDRDSHGSGGARWARRAGLALLALIVLLALLNVFGQRPATSTASAAEARLQVYAPAAVRSGLVYTARFRIDVREEMKKAILVLAPGWADQYTFNGVAPQPIGEASADGKISFTLGHIRRRDHYTLFVSLQTNPTNVGRHDQTVWLYDGARELAVIRRKVTVWP